jgi:hypothetical protein
MQWDILTVIGVISIFLTAVVTLIAGSHWWTHRGETKALSYDFSSAQLTEVKHDFSGRLEITFNKRPVSDISIVTIRMWNSGKLPIRRDDFDANLRLVLEGTKVLSAEVSSRQPNELDIQGLGL